MMRNKIKNNISSCNNISSRYEEMPYSRNENFYIFENQPLSNNPPTMHYHDVIEIGIVTKGSGTFVINDSINHFNKGNVSLIFPGDIHISSSNINDESIWTYILVDINLLINENPHIFSSVSRRLYEGSLPSRIFSPRHSKTVIDYVMRLYREQKENRDDCAEMSAALCAALLIEVSRNYRRSQPPAIVSKSCYEKVGPAIEYIMRCYDTEISARELADMCFLSETHFRRIFKQATGFAPLDYLYRIRISAAKSLLKANTLSVLQISNTVGYHSQSSFNKHFKHYVGITPTEYERNAASARKA